MKSILSLLIVLFSISICKAEDIPVTSWGKQYGFPLEALCVSGDKSGNCFIAGTTSDSLSPTYSGKKDGFLSKLDPSGNNLWTINFGSKEDDYCYSITTDSDGNILVAGKTSGNIAVNNLGGTDAFIVKINSSGNILWKKQFGTSKDDDLRFLLIDNHGLCYVCGSTRGNFDGNSKGGLDAIFVKVNNNGDIIWQKQYGTSTDEKAEYIGLDKNNTSYFILSSKEILEYDDQGNSIGKFRHTMYQAKGIVIDDSLNIYLGGTNGVASGSKAILIKYNKDFVKKWERTFGSGPWTGINGLTQFKDGTDDILVGVCQNYPSCLGVCRRYDHDGNTKWIYTLKKTGVSSICGHSVSIDGLGNCYLTGFTDGSLFNTKVKSQEMFLSKVTISAQTGVKERISEPGKFELNQNYPNPFNPTTTISYSIDKPAQVEIKIYNMEGKEIKTLKNHFQNPGEYSVIWDSKDNINHSVCSGIYLCRLKTPYAAKTSKLVLIK